MARTKQKANKSMAKKAPRKRLKIGCASIPAQIGMVRNHCGPFLLSKSIDTNNNQKSNTSINDDPMKYRYNNSYKNLIRDGIWQIYFEEGDRIRYRSISAKTKKDYFEYLDVSFYIIDNKCSFLPNPIKSVLKQCLEPLYIRPTFGEYCGKGRGVATYFEIFEHKQWKIFYKLYVNFFCDETEGECLNGYEEISHCIQSDMQINRQFCEDLLASKEMTVSRLSPDFENYNEYDAFRKQRLHEERKNRDTVKDINQKIERKVGEKRKLTDMDGLDHDLECDHDMKRQKVQI